jgi:hypothetical protein
MASLGHWPIMPSAITLMLRGRRNVDRRLPGRRQIIAAPATAKRGILEIPEATT